MNFKSLQELRIKKEAETLKAVQERAIRQASGVPSRLSILNIKRDTPSVIKWLHSYDKGVDMFIHTWCEGRGITEICKAHYDETCEWCGKESWAQPTRMMIGYIYSLVGKQWEMVDQKTKETRRGEYNPIRLALIPMGKNDANVKPFILADREKIFNKRLWIMFKTQAAKGFTLNPPEILYEEEYKERIGEQAPSFDLPETALNITKMNKNDVFRLILSVFENVQIDKLIPPSIEPVKTENPFKEPIKTDDFERFLDES